MANTTALRLIAAASLALALPLSACGSSAATLSGPFPYCYGPETPDDLEDLFDRDVMRVDDSVCASGAYPAGHGVAYAPDWASLPDVGEELDSDSEWGYHRSHRRSSSPRVVYVAKPSRPTSSVLVVREASVGSSQVRRDSATRADTARRTAPAGSSTITRGGLGVKDRPSSGSVRAQDNKSSSSSSSSSRSSSSGSSKGK